MRLAYADPPYPGQAKRWYGDHPDYGGEVDHAQLIERLKSYDGWALSTSAVNLQNILALCPSDIRIGIWHNTNAAPPGRLGNWWWTWEAVIFSLARPPALPTKNLISVASLQGFLGATIAGEKPPGFCRWVFALLGANQDDDLDDLFPGSGAVGRDWEAWRSQMVIA